MTQQPAEGPLTILKRSQKCTRESTKAGWTTRGGRDTMPLKDLKAKVQAGSHRMTIIGGRVLYRMSIH